MDNRQQRLWDAIDACRPGSDDIDNAQLPELNELGEALTQSPELQSRMDAVQSLDARIQAAFPQVPCPPGLADRISARIAEEVAEQEPSVESQQVAVATAESALPANDSLWSRRRLWVSVAVTAAVLALMAIPFFAQQRRWKVGEVLARTPHWKKQLVGKAWRKTGAPKSRPASQQLWYAPDEVTSVSLAEDSTAAVYRYVRPLNAPQTGEILLYVVKGNSANLPHRPPALPHFNSGGVQIGVWAEGGMIYALVVVNSDKGYRRIVGELTFRAA